MNYILTLQQPNLSEIYVSGVDISRDEVLISHDRDDASIFETLHEAQQLLDLIRPTLMDKRPGCKFFVDEL